MHNQNLKVFQGVDNTLFFDFRDTDRQPVLKYDNTFALKIVDIKTNNLLLTKYLVVNDEQRGRYESQLTYADIKDIAPGMYNYVVSITDSEGREEYLYSSLDQSATGTLELIERGLPIARESLTILWEDFIQRNVDLSPSNNNFFVTSPISGNIGSGSTDSSASFSVLMDNFSGDFWIEGNLESSITADYGWTKILLEGEQSPIVSYTSSSAGKIYTIFGNFLWFRFQYRPAIGNVGTIKKIIFKK